ncbi:MAG: hypothetical protein AAF601_00140 [Pseudomonadota bacterium]
MTLLLADMGFASAFGPGLATAIQAQLDAERCLVRNLRFIGADFQEQICAFQDNEDVDILTDALHRLIGQAIADLIARLGPDVPATPVDVILCLPETAPEDGMPSVRLNALGESLPPLIYQALAGSCLEATDMRLVTDAQSGPARVIQSIFRKGADRAFLFICADSYSDRDRLNALLGQKRLFADEVANYSLIPGEAAAAMLILPEAMRISEPLAYIGGAASAPEPVGEMDNADTLSQAISDSALTALDGLGAGRRPVDRFLTDFNNSRYRASEGAYCLHRLVAGYLAEDVEPLYPALEFGDCGAAYFGLAMAQLCAEATQSEQPLQALILSSTTWSKSRAAIVAQTNPIRLFGLQHPTVEEDDVFEDDPDTETEDADAPPTLEEIT